MTYDQLLDHVRKFWSDKSRSQSQTKADLGALIDEIEILRDTLTGDDHE